VGDRFVGMTRPAKRRAACPDDDGCRRTESRRLRQLTL
jgi:hypothetical protein